MIDSGHIEEVPALPEDVDPEWWDSQSPPERVGMKWFFLKAFQEGDLEGIEPGLLLVRSSPEGPLVAAQAFARMRLALDCIASETVQRAARTIRRAIPRFLELDMLMFGLPASMADQECFISASIPEKEAFHIRRALARHALAMFEAERRSACVWKEFDPESLAEWGPVLAARFTRFDSLPVAEQGVHWEGASGYRGALRSSYRRQLDAGLKRARASGLTVSLEGDPAAGIEEFHDLYMQVLTRSKTRLETLTPSFFQGLSRSPRMRRIEVRQRGQLAGAALCYSAPPDVLVFLYVGMDHEVQRHSDLYFVLLHAVIQLASEEGVRRIRWGQTSLDAKGRFGARPVPLSFFMGLRSSLARALVSRYAESLFPLHPALSRRVFKANVSSPSSPSRA